VSVRKNIVLFWSDFNRIWETRRIKTSPDENASKPSAKLTSYPCPVCKKPLEKYSYITAILRMDKIKLCYGVLVKIRGRIINIRM
jgi:hypothetical protein